MFLKTLIHISKVKEAYILAEVDPMRCRSKDKATSALSMGLFVQRHSVSFAAISK